MANFELIDYDKCITNLTSSIEKYFHLNPSYKTLKEADEALSKKDYKNVIIMVFDGMGSAIIDKNPIKDSYLKDKVEFLLDMEVELSYIAFYQYF